MIIIHGNYQLLSRQRLNDYLKKARAEKKEVITVNGKNVSETEIKQALESLSFFNTNRLLIIENLFSAPKSNRQEKILNSLKKDTGQTEVVLWESKKIDGRRLKSFPQKTQVFKCELPVIIFKLLDSIAPDNAKLVINLFHQTIQNDPVELVFFMLSRRLHDLIIAKDLGTQGLTQQAPWQKQQLVNQANRFELKKIIKIYQQFLKIDWEIKTGQSFLPLEGRLDLVLADL